MQQRQPSRGSRSTRGDQAFAVLLSLLLFLCWLQGGVVDDPGPADELLQLLGLPLVVLGGWRLAATVTLPRPVRFALALAILLVALPLLQVLPLPSVEALAGSGRQAISADLQVADGALGLARISLLPLASERALWSLMPALALFLGGLALPASLRRRMLQLVLVLVLASAGFAFQQLSLPDGSPELLYSKWGRNFGGFFINPNHQGTALVLGAVIAAALFVDGLRKAGDGNPGHRHWIYGVLCVACVLMIPLARGTAAALLAIVGLAAIVAMLGVMPKRWARHHLWPKAYLFGLSLLAVAAICAAVLIRHVDSERGVIAQQTARIGTEFAPLGTGMGTFVPIYLQEQELREARTKTVNHAHDEYLQWWLEGGIPALAVVGFGLAVFGWSGWRVLRVPSRRARTVAASAWTCLLVLCLHSVVDFPLRTTTLMATAGLLAGLLFGALGSPLQESHGRRHRDAASQRA